MRVIHGTKDVDDLMGLVDDQNEIWGHGSADNLAGGKLDDVLIGGKGDDSLWGDRGNDALRGNSGDDRLKGSVGDDLLSGGTGDDVLSGGKDDDVLAGGKGNDDLDGNSGNDVLGGGSGDDTLHGSLGDDWLDGGGGADHVYGGSGSDTVIASSGADTYSGGSGYDTLDFSKIAGKINVDLSKGTAKLAFGHNVMTDHVSGFETIAGNNAGGHYTGSKHADTFAGGDGNDWFRGLGGSDHFTGGDGADTFSILKKDLAGGAVDEITDFQVGRDHLNLSDFAKGGHPLADVVRFVDAGNDTMVQSLVKGHWTNVVQLDGVHADDVGFHILT